MASISKNRANINKRLRYLTEKRTKKHRKRYYKQKRINKARRRNRTLATKLASKKYTTLKAPKILSISSNLSETMEYFINIKENIARGNPIKIDLSEVKTISADALLYLLAIYDNIRSRNIAYHVVGNFPQHRAAADKFKRSGFLKYVTANGDYNIRDKNVVQIYGGRQVDPEIARDLVTLAQRTLHITRTSTKVVYEVIIEIIINTVHHAYKKDELLPKWYAYAEYDDDNNEVIYTLLDTGLGIPETVKRKFTEKIISVQHQKLIMSAMEGQLRTQTGKAYRGRGLPMIKKASEDGQLTDLLLISGKGIIRMEEGTLKAHEMQQSFTGTLYMWRVRTK